MKITSLLLTLALSLTSFSALAEMVNLNKANAAAFQHYLTGIGEKKAGDIVSYRTKNKSFKTIEEIMEVKGIGEGTFKKIKSDLSLTKGATSAPVKKAKSASTKANTKNKDTASKAAKAEDKSAASKEAKTKKSPATS